MKRRQLSLAPFGLSTDRVGGTVSGKEGVMTQWKHGRMWPMKGTAEQTVGVRCVQGSCMVNVS